MWKTPLITVVFHFFCKCHASPTLVCTSVDHLLVKGSFHILHRLLEIHDVGCNSTGEFRQFRFREVDVVIILAPIKADKKGNLVKPGWIVSIRKVNDPSPARITRAGVIHRTKDPSGFELEAGVLKPAIGDVVFQFSHGTDKSDFTEDPIITIKIIELPDGPAWWMQFGVRFYLAQREIVFSKGLCFVRGNSDQQKVGSKISIFEINHVCILVRDAVLNIEWPGLAVGVMHQRCENECVLVKDFSKERMLPELQIVKVIDGNFITWISDRKRQFVEHSNLYFRIQHQRPMLFAACKKITWRQARLKQQWLEVAEPVSKRDVTLFTVGIDER